MVSDFHPVYPPNCQQKDEKTRLRDAIITE
jgi:hypothetical protein